MVANGSFMTYFGPPHYSKSLNQAFADAGLKRESAPSMAPFFIEAYGLKDVAMCWFHKRDVELVRKLMEKLPPEQYVLVKDKGDTSYGTKDSFAEKFRKYTWTPETFIIENDTVPEDFLDFYKKNPETWWIFKPAGGSLGNGIELLTPNQDVEGVMRELSDIITNRWKKKKHDDKAVLQIYLKNPLLHKGRKFDFRSYFLLASVDPLMGFVHHGRGRKCCKRYKTSGKDSFGKNFTKTRHLTNAFQNKRHARSPEDIQVTFEDFVKLLDRQGPEFKQNFAGYADADAEALGKAFMSKLVDAWRTVCPSIGDGYSRFKGSTEVTPFNLFGGDVMVTEDGGFYLIEINSRPCGALLDLVPDATRGMVALLVEVRRMKMQQDCFNTKVISGGWVQAC